MKYLPQQTNVQAESNLTYQQKTKRKTKSTHSVQHACSSRHSGLSRAVHAQNVKRIRTAADGAIAGSALLGALFSSVNAFKLSKRFYKSYTSSRTVSVVVLANLKCQKRCRLNLPVSSCNLAQGSVALLLGTDIS